MNRDAAKNRINKLRKELQEHNHNYYVLSAPVISDYEFDILLKELQNLETSYPEFEDPNSPTKRVGGEITKEFLSVKHKYPMLSLDNTYTREEVEDFDKRVKKWLAEADDLLNEELVYIGELKYDGVAIGLTYEHGELKSAVTRGDGEYGDDVTANVKTIKSIPLKLRGSAYPDLFEIRGEVFLSRESFAKINREREVIGDLPFANPRNSASGTLKMQDSSVVAARNLDCFLYALYADRLPCNNHFDNLAAAREWGFKISKNMVKCNDIKGVFEFIDHWNTERKNMEVDIDGIVVKVNSYRMQEHLGFTAKYSRWAIAYKYKAERAATKLISIDYQVGRTGTVTPVANLKPVLLSGTTVKRATLHNADQIAKLDVRVGDSVFVEKGGEIIPKIVDVDIADRSTLSKPTVFLTHCPVCNTPLAKTEGEVAHYCPNSRGCAPQIKGKIEHFISRKAMDIDGMGEETIEQLYENGLISDISSLYELKYEQLIKLERFADKSAVNLLAGIENSKKTPFEKLLYALGIRYVGETVAKKLAVHFKSIDNLAAAGSDSLIEAEEIGEKIAVSIIEYFKDPLNLQILKKLKLAGLNFKIKEDKDYLISTKLDGLSFVVSGVFKNFSRDELKAAIAKNGGRVLSGISSKTSYVIAGDNMGPGKLEKAGKLKIPILSENDFIKMIG